MTNWRFEFTQSPQQNDGQTGGLPKISRSRPDFGVGLFNTILTSGDYPHNMPADMILDRVIRVRNGRRGRPREPSIVSPRFGHHGTGIIASKCPPAYDHIRDDHD